MKNKDVRITIPVITCHDTCSSGIGESDLKHVLKKFHRGKEAKEMKKRGLGLGLYLVDRIISMHKGHLEINSKKGEGTEVVIRLPIYHGS